MTIRILVSRESCSRFFHLVVGVDREKDYIFHTSLLCTRRTVSTQYIHTYTYKLTHINTRNMFSLTSSLTAATARASTSFSSSSLRRSNAGRGKMTIVNVGASEKDNVPVGAKVRVNKSVVVYHVPKSKGAATDLNGMEGEVAQRADELDGTYISANLPVKVALPLPDGSGKTFLVHLTADELEIL